MATTRKPKKTRTSAELKQQLDAARKRIATLEKLAYAEELTELIRATSIVADFASIQSRLTDVKATAILSAIASAVGLKRVEITQASPTPRKPTDPNKPRTTRSTAKNKAK